MAVGVPRATVEETLLDRTNFSAIIDGNAEREKYTETENFLDRVFSFGFAFIHGLTDLQFCR